MSHVVYSLIRRSRSECTWVKNKGNLSDVIYYRAIILLAIQSNQSIPSDAYNAVTREPFSLRLMYTLPSRVYWIVNVEPNGTHAR
jgi:hypothetical protein